MRFSIKLTRVKKCSHYVSCCLFEVLVKTIQVLHESYPAIAHGHLKPSNILISKTWFNNNKIKVTAIDSQVSRIDTNIKSDIYSLGKIAEQFFQIFISMYFFYQDKLINLNKILIDFFIVPELIKISDLN